ncbi:hypothetical protein [Mucilaginibacter sp. NFX135]|uniref:hypothetical protein n=1 Tax=Mucilaginibacter sp. NFX135 TaxID=3402687 RepID=UPI003AFB018C
MKKVTFTIITLLFVCHFSYAQWAVSGTTNTYYNLSGNVAIGGSSFAAKFAVYQTSALGSVAKNNLLLSSIGGSAANNVQNNLWLVRNAAGSDFTTARLHDGISIDGSFMTPQTNTLTWWERDPTLDVQSWGNSANTYVTINKGNVGIGTTSPNANLEVAGKFVVAGNNSNLDNRNGTVSLSFLENTGKMLIGWNRTQGAGETDFISNQGGGNVGGFAFYNHSNTGTENQLMWLTGDGRLMIGLATGYTGNNKLAVGGGIIAESVTVKLQANWPDYVFKKDYQLKPLSEVKAYIDQNQHLPEIPSEQEISKNGLNLGEMNKLLMKKVEELTLYLIEKDQKEKEQEKVNQDQQNEITRQKINVDLMKNQLKQESDRVGNLEKQLTLLLHELNK